MTYFWNCKWLLLIEQSEILGDEPSELGRVDYEDYVLEMAEP